MAYETTKKATGNNHVLASGVGEVVACVIRVPTELLKQRLQNLQHNSITAAFKHVFQTSGGLGLYRGYFITVFRDVPFAMIQFPLYERLKVCRYLPNLVAI